MGWWDDLKGRTSHWADRLALKPAAEEEEGSFEMYAYGTRGAIGPRSARPGRTGWRQRLHPTREQWTILTLLGIMLAVILVLGEFRVGRIVLWPFAIISTIFHEFGHAAVCWLTGGHMGNIQIRMDESGVTRFSGGWICAILPAGYIGSTLIGALLVFMSFGVRTAKYTALAVAFILLFTLYYSDGIFTLLSSVALLALLLGAFRYKEGVYSRHFVLFLGAIASVQSINSILNGTVFNTIKGSDAYAFAQHCSIIVPAVVYGLVWLAISAALLAGGVLAALVVFKRVA